LKILIMRHGEAGMHPVDERRALTGRGRAEAERVALQIRAAGFIPGQVWHSGLVRAQETAAIVGGALGVSPRAQAGLTPESDPGAVVAMLQSLGDDESLVIVSHMPLVSQLTGLLIEGRPGRYPFATAEALVLEMAYPSSGSASELKRFIP